MSDGKARKPRHVVPSCVIQGNEEKCRCDSEQRGRDANKTQDALQASNNNTYYYYY